MLFYLLLICVPAAMGQLILGFCPTPPPYVKNLDMSKYSGDWYVVAQSHQHPLSAPDCAKVAYFKTEKGLSANFSYVDRQRNRTMSKHAVVKTELWGPSDNLYLRFDDIPRSYQFRVLKSNYTDVAVEYTCLSGAIKHFASATVLHRKRPVNLEDLNTVLNRFNLTSDVPHQLRKEMRLVNHVNC